MVSSQKARGGWAGQDCNQPCLQVHGLKVLRAAATSADDRDSPRSHAASQQWDGGADTHIMLPVSVPQESLATREQDRKGFPRWLL